MSQHLSQDEVLIVVQMLILQGAMLVPVSWRILLQNIVLHTDTALSDERGEGECPLYWRYPGQVIRSHHGPMSGVWSMEDGDHSNNFIFGLKPNSVIPRGLSEWIESTHFRYPGDWGRYSN